MLVVHHVTYSINSLCHFFGEKRYPTDDHSRNLLWLALPTLGESWHNNHHAFPTSAAHGLRRRDIDPSAAVIRGLEKLGLVWDVVRISPERQAQKAAALGRGRARPSCAASSRRPCPSGRSSSSSGTAPAFPPPPPAPDHLPRPLDATPRRTCCAPPASSASAAPTCPGRSSPTTSTRRSSCSTSGSRRRSTAPRAPAWHWRRRAPAARCARRRCPPPSCARADKRHSLRRDARAVRHHYDLPPEFFALFLGESLTYSCALFTRGATTLEEAQEQKLDLVCRKLDLRARPAACSTWAAAGAASRSTPPSATTCGAGHHPLRAAGGRGAAARPRARARGPRGDPGGRLPRAAATTRSTPSRASAWSSTWARARSTCTRSSWRARCAPAAGCSTTGSRACAWAIPRPARSRSATSSPTAPRSISRASSWRSSAPGS